MTTEEIAEKAIASWAWPSYRDIAAEAARIAIQVERDRCIKIATGHHCIHGKVCGAYIAQHIKDEMIP